MNYEHFISSLENLFLEDGYTNISEDEVNKLYFTSGTATGCNDERILTNHVFFPRRIF